MRCCVLKHALNTLSTKLRGIPLYLRDFLLLICSKLCQMSQEIQYKESLVSERHQHSGGGGGTEEKSVMCESIFHNQGCAL